MASAKWLRMQAARCATLMAQTADEEALRRYQRLEQNYLRLADAEEQLSGPASAGEGERKPAA